MCRLTCGKSGVVLKEGYSFLVQCTVISVDFCHDLGDLIVLADRLQLEERRRRTQSAGDLERRFCGRTDDSKPSNKTESEKGDGQKEARESHAREEERKDGEGKNDSKSNHSKKNSLNLKQGAHSKAPNASPVRQVGRQQQYQRGQHGYQSYGHQYHGQQSHGQQQKQHGRQNRRVTRNDVKQNHDTKQNGSKNNHKSKQGKSSENQSGMGL